MDADWHTWIRLLSTSWCLDCMNVFTSRVKNNMKQLLSFKLWCHFRRSTYFLWDSFSFCDFRRFRAARRSYEAFILHPESVGQDDWQRMIGPDGQPQYTRRLVFLCKRSANESSWHGGMNYMRTHPECNYLCCAFLATCKARRSSPISAASSAGQESQIVSACQHCFVQEETAVECNRM